MAQGLWSAQERKLNINLLELRAIHKALLHFHDLVKGQDILVLTDNTTAKAHINRWGGTHSRTLMTETLTLGHWAEFNLLSLRASHISGTANVRADALSRQQIDQAEWKLDPALFQKISLRFGLPKVDLFATPSNHQLPRFFARFPSPGAEAVDALRSPWPLELLYAFPPLPLIPKVIRKLLEEKAELILVAPHWPRRPWFADLKALSVTTPWRIPDNQIALSQGALTHPEPQWLQLTVWRLSGTS
ncbi:uncharacterized protein LOC131197588 [Ahaetulla prasina]|uniref:uncharacterized protein LOC131197588 n=1 Tax=Ahaetulla prasina TaxID=499056 RepID=UPI0026494627|nr:uncharacterized protein LOC131197588 [Ahaetulla prasina]